MSATRRAVVAAAVVVGMLVATSTLAGAKAVNPRDGCTILTNRQITKTMGLPIAGHQYYGPTSCTYTLGDPSKTPGNQMVLRMLWPGPEPVGSAKGTVEDARAIDTLSNDNVSDVNGVGISAYFDATQRKLVVLASKKRAFALIRNLSSAGTPLTPRDIAVLEKLAKQAVTRLTA